MSELAIYGIVTVWWSFAVVVFTALTYEGQGKLSQHIAAAVFWPLFAVFQIPVMLWRIPFRTTKAIRTDLRNRKLLRKFEAWLKDQDDVQSIAELEAKIDQMHGLADEGCTAPNAAYRWCERIDEVATHGAQEEYAQYAMSSKRAARPPEATTDPL